MSSHTEEKPHSGEVCGNQLAYKDSLTNHTHDRSDGETYSCKSCVKSFACQDAFKMHMLVHSGDKQYRGGT